jgi:hypothetical protein
MNQAIVGKQSVFIRSVFDTSSRSISRQMAARLLRAHRKQSLRRIPAGWKFINGFEPTVISRSPVQFDVNF